VVTRSARLGDVPALVRPRLANASIAPDALAKLFTPFERLDAAQAGIAGTGLGLALSRQLMHAMHGTLEVSSLPGQGSTFWLDLHLPDITGEEVMRRPQADPATSDIPIVVLSADATQGHIDRLRATGATAYLTKPFAFGDLLHTVDDLLNDPNQSSASGADVLGLRRHNAAAGPILNSADSAHTVQ
jgi:CheY-like chemotaxis protein